MPDRIRDDSTEDLAARRKAIQRVADDPDTPPDKARNFRREIGNIAKEMKHRSGGGGGGKGAGKDGKR